MLSNFVGCGPPKEKRPFWASSIFIFLFVLLALFMEGAYSKGEGMGTLTLPWRGVWGNEACEVSP